MRPTRLGVKAIVFYALLMLSFFAAPYLNLFFLLLAFSSVMALLSVWWSHQNIRGLSGSLSGLAPMPAGASQLTKAKVHSPRRARFDLSLSVDVDLGINPENQARVEKTLAHGMKVLPGDNEVEVMMPALPRGIYALSRGRVTSVFPFGAIRAWRSIETQERIVVYPAPADLAAHRARNGSCGAGGLGGSASQEMGPSGLREFRDGDEMRRVHWKASARRQQLVVREMEGDSAPGVELVLDLRAETDRLEEALSLISALVLECIEQKELLTVHSQDHQGTYGEGHAAFEELLVYLAGASQMPADAAPPPAVSPTILRLPLAEVMA